MSCLYIAFRYELSLGLRVSFICNNLYLEGHFIKQSTVAKGYLSHSVYNSTWYLKHLSLCHIFIYIISAEKLIASVS